MNYAPANYETDNGSTGSYSQGYTAANSYSNGASYDSGTTMSAKYSSPHEGAGYEALNKQLDSHHSIVESYLEDERPWTPIVTDLGELKPIIEQTFERMTGQTFPHDGIAIQLCTPEEFKRVYLSFGNNWSEGIMGFSFNQFGKGVSSIFIKTDHLDQVLLTIGHEIGHVMSKTLPHPQDEEAKAHAFSIAWIETISEHNIAGLQPNIRLNPARNGLHDVGYNFVTYLLNSGSSALDVFKTLAHGLTSMLTT